MNLVTSGAINCVDRCLAALLLSNSENREHLKNFRNVDCVLANHKKVQDKRANPQNHKLITVAVCGLVTSHLIGLFLPTQ